MLERLYEVGLNGVFQQHRDGPRDAQHLDGHGLAAVCVSYDNPRNPFLEVTKVFGQTQHRHEFAGNRNVETIFTWHTGRWATQPNRDVAQCPVVNVEDTLPLDAPRIDM